LEQELYMVLGGFHATFHNQNWGVAEFLDALMKESEECLLPRSLRPKLHLGKCQHPHPSLHQIHHPKGQTLAVPPRHQKVL
jgi:hypothetical protein